MNKSTRFEIFKRDNFTCQYCGRQVPIVILEIDHILPKAEGGGDDINNLITSCFDCNRGKGKTLIGAVRLKENREQEIERIKERNKQIEEYEKFLKEEKIKEEIILKDINDYWSNINSNQYCLSEHGLLSIKRFLKSLTPIEIKECMSLIPEYVGKDIEKRFRYFCGIINNKIAEKNGDDDYLKVQKIKRYLSSDLRGRGTGYYRKWELYDICHLYSEVEIKLAIDKAYSEQQNNYWNAVLECLGYKDLK